MWFIVKILWTWNLWEKKKIFPPQFRQWHYRNCGENKKFPPQFRQWHYRNCGGNFFFSTFSSMELPKFVFLFRKSHCHNPSLFCFLTFSAIPLSQLLKKILFPYFGNGISNFFSPYFGNAIASSSLSLLFFSLFRQWYCHNFFFPISTMSLPQLVVTNFFN